MKRKEISKVEQSLMQKLSAISEEERSILSGTELDKKIYTSNNDFIIKADKITGGARDITVRTHTRYTDFPLHKHNYLEMMIVLSGGVTHHINGEKIALSEGDILILNKHVAHSIDKADTPDIGVNIIISDSFIDSLSKELSETVFSELAAQNSRSDGSGIYLCFCAKGNKQISNVIENLLFELLEYSPDMRILRYTTTLLFYYLSMKSKSLLKLASRLPDKKAKRRAQILGYIRSNYRTATLGALAEEMFLSPPYLSKIITEYFGKSFKELLLEERMARAKELLLDTDMPVGDIIRTVGYENESYFHKMFKKTFGKTPFSLRRCGEADEKS